MRITTDHSRVKVLGNGIKEKDLGTDHGEWGRVGEPGAWARCCGVGVWGFRNCLQHKKFKNKLLRTVHLRT